VHPAQLALGRIVAQADLTVAADARVVPSSPLRWQRPALPMQRPGLPALESRRKPYCALGPFAGFLIYLTGVIGEILLYSLPFIW
jgi:hypothetical protein